MGDLTLELSYHFEPNHPRDGVTVKVPAPLLPVLPPERLEWLVIYGVVGFKTHAKMMLILRREAGVFRK